MNLSVLYPALTLGGLGMLFGILLGYASKKFEIELDPKIVKIREVLPGANCGGCGFSGCDAYARAVVEEGASSSACTVGGSATAEFISNLMGVEIEIKTKQVAFIKCRGSYSNIKIKKEVENFKSCSEAHEVIKENSSGCNYGCLGAGSCFTVCKFGAINIEDGLASVQEDKCVNCGACIKVCPRNLIESVPADKSVRVQCSSKASGKAVREVCSVGCIGCKICEKNCAFEAIKVTDNLAYIDYEKCTKCKVCETKCPTKAISILA